jgi:ketosteroid isomerase-like protein
MNRVTDTVTDTGAPATRPHDLSGQRILSMTPDGQTGGSIAATLRHRLESLAQAIRDKDLDRVMSFYAHDVEVFDVRFSLNVPGAAAYRNNFEHWFEAVEGPLKYEIHGLRVVPGEFSAFCHYLGLVVAAWADGSKTGYWVRVTCCFERREGEWLVTHEHVSMPAS